MAIGVVFCLLLFIASCSTQVTTYARTEVYYGTDTETTDTDTDTNDDSSSGISEKVIISVVAAVLGALAVVLIVFGVFGCRALYRRRVLLRGGIQKVESEPVYNVEMQVPPTRIKSTLVPIRTLYTSFPAKSWEITDAREIVLGPQIGKGNAGVVYKATWRGTQVAVKRLNVQETTVEWLTTFRNECQLMKSMAPHTNVLQFFGVLQEPLSLIVEYCANGSLETLLEDNTKRIDVRMQVLLLKHIAMGMSHLAQQRIVHRDLAARNCLLREGNVAVVADFGMSRMHNEENRYFATTAHHGWPVKWMAPETFENLVFSEKTDVFSFGVVCIEVLTRAEPYPEWATDKFGLNVLSQDLVGTLPKYIPTNTPDFLQTIIRQCVSKDPIVRPTFKNVCRSFDAE